MYERLMFKAVIFASGRTATNVAGPRQYWGGGSPGKPFGCCWLFVAVAESRFMPDKEKSSGSGETLRGKGKNRQRPYRDERTGSLSNSEVNRRRARSVLGWGTAWEALRVLLAFFLVSVAPV